MSIEFDTLDSGTLLGELRAVLSRPTVVITADEYQALRAVLPDVVCDFQGAVNVSTPSYLGFDATLPTAEAIFVGTVVSDGALDVSISSPLLRFYDGNRLECTLPAPLVHMTDAFPGFIILNLRLDGLFAGEYEATVLTDEVAVQEAHEGVWAAVLTEIFRVNDSLTLLARVAGTITSSVVARDYMAAVFYATLQSEVVMDWTLTSNLRLIGLLADMLTIEDPSVGHLDAVATIVAAFLIGDAVIPVLDGGLEDDIEFALLDNELEVKLSGILTLVDELEMELESEALLTLVALLTDQVAIAHETELTVAMLAELLDTVGFAINLNIPGLGTFVGYAMNIRNAAVTEYDNYPFDSFATIAGRPFAAGPDGVFALTGEDDDGDPIRAQVRTGILGFGSLTKVLNGWLMLKSDGEMVLKTITMDSGQKKENWYKMKARPEGEPVETRFDIAKGLTGTYWQWELVNVDGAYFEVDAVKVWPISLARRYSGR